jgi:adenosylhomocysteine nucleosidase
LKRLLLLSLCACATPRVVVLVSANAEWKALSQQLTEPQHADTPYGPWLVHAVGGREVVFFHGGYGKVSAAGSTQYAIARWHPGLLVNLGTCGGFNEAKVQDVVLADKTVIYDLYEAMGDPDETIADYTTALDVSRWPQRLAAKVHRATLVSADRDLMPAELPKLAATYRASYGDWESGAIAYVAAHNRVPLYILRSVTDVVSATQNPTAGNLELWQAATVTAMAQLIALLADALPELTHGSPGS